MLPSSEVLKMIRGSDDFRESVMKASVRHAGPIALVFNISVYFSRGVRPSGRAWAEMPALLIKTSRRPNMSCTHSAALEMDESKVTSSWTASTERFGRDDIAASPLERERQPISI